MLFVLLASSGCWGRSLCKLQRHEAWHWLWPWNHLQCWDSMHIHSSFTPKDSSTNKETVLLLCSWILTNCCMYWCVLWFVHSLMHCNCFSYEDRIWSHRLICLVDSYTVWHFAVASVTKTGFWLQIRMQCSCFKFQSQDLDYNHVSFIFPLINSIVMQCRINFIPACIFLISRTHIILDNNLVLRVWLNTRNFEYQLNCCICSVWNPSFQSFGCRS